MNLFPPEGNVPRPRPSAAGASASDAKASTARGPTTLIQKLNLQARAEEQDALFRDAKGKGKAVDPAEHAGSPVKASSGDSREDVLRERKAKMVLDARWSVLSYPFDTLSQLNVHFSSVAGVGKCCKRIKATENTNGIETSIVVWHWSIHTLHFGDHM